MKALTIAQPWATLVVHGLKRLETRSWATRHRGPLAIHAAKGFPAAGRLLCHQEPYRTLLAGIGFFDWFDLPAGMVLGLVEVAACTRIAELAHVADLERLLGDFGPRRWAWSLVKPRLLAAPLPCRGQLKIFDLPDQLLAPNRCCA